MRPDPAGNPLLSRRLWPRRPARARVLLVAAASAVTLLAAACSSGGSGMGTVSGTITIAAAPGIDDAPLWLALQKGLFAADGLHVVIKDFGSESAELNAIETNHAQIAASDYGNIFAVEQEKSNVRLLADGYDAGTGSVEILSLPNYNVTTALDLQTSPIGLPVDTLVGSKHNGVPESLYVAAAREVMSNYLASGADTLSWSLMSQPAEISELASGKLHAALLTEPYIYEAEADLGATPVLDVFSGGTAGLPISGYAATAAWVKGNPTAVADFQAAIKQAQSDAGMAGPIQQVLPKLPGAGISTQDAAMATVGTYPTSINVGELQRVNVTMTTQSMLSQSNAVRPGDMVVGPRS